MLAPDMKNGPRDPPSPDIMMGFVGRKVQAGKVKCCKGSASCEKLHVEFAAVDYIAFPDFYKASEFGYCLPAIVQ